MTELRLAPVCYGGVSLAIYLHGVTKTLDHAKIGAVTLKPPPKKYGVTHWRIETFKFSTDPELVGKVSKRLARCQAGSNEPTWHRERRVRVPPPAPHAGGVSSRWQLTD